MTQNSCSALEPYALRVLGDSMEPEFPDGCVVIIDPCRAPRDGSYVVVKVPRLRTRSALQHPRRRGAAGGQKAFAAQALRMKR